MAESRVKRENFITVQGFMLTDLKLKGNELLIYACIYGFSQAENQVFNGSLQYLADWTNSTKQGVMKCLKSLEEKKFIVKKENYINGVKFCEYYATKFNTSVNKVDEGMQQSSIGGMQQSLPNNIGFDNTPNIIKEIIDYLNSVVGSNFKHTTTDTKKHISARLKEGFTLSDFKRVIDKKHKEWNGTEWSKYLRPSTLFGSKFESYLNEQESNNHKNGGKNNARTDEFAGFDFSRFEV